MKLRRENVLSYCRYYNVKPGNPPSQESSLASLGQLHRPSPLNQKATKLEKIN